jgi:hypothetical protein
MICTKCAIDKPLEEFPVNRRIKIGHMQPCLACNTTQACNRCGIVKPFDAFAKTTKTLNGRRQPCNDCRNAEYRKIAGPIQRKGSIHLVIGGQHFMVCNACTLSKPVEEFKRNKDKRTQPCNVCASNQTKARWIENPEENRARWSAWQRLDRAANPGKHRSRDTARRERDGDKRRAQASARRAQNPEKARAKARANYAKNRPHRRAQAKASREKNLPQARAKAKALQEKRPGLYRALKRTANIRRKARLRGLPATFTTTQRTFMLQFWGYACAVCGQQEGLFGAMLTDDHWIPLASPDCPGTTVGNMVPLCGGNLGCNQSKQGKDAHIWLLSRYSRQKAMTIEKKIAAYFEIVRQRAHQQAS